MHVVLAHILLVEMERFRLHVCLHIIMSAFLLSLCLQEHPDYKYRPVRKVKPVNQRNRPPSGMMCAGSAARYHPYAGSPYYGRPMHNGYLTPASSHGSDGQVYPGQPQMLGQGVLPLAAVGTPTNEQGQSPGLRPPTYKVEPSWSSSDLPSLVVATPAATPTQAVDTYFTVQGEQLHPALFQRPQMALIPQPTHGASEHGKVAVANVQQCAVIAPQGGCILSSRSFTNLTALDRTSSLTDVIDPSLLGSWSNLVGAEPSNAHSQGPPVPPTRGVIQHSYPPRNAPQDLSSPEAR